MHLLRLSLLALPLATLAACTVNPRPVVVTPPPPAVVQAPPPAVVMGAPGAPIIIDVPPGHYPPPGSCRIWVPGVPAAQQKAAGSCAELQQQVPNGAVLLRG